ncbi:MAG: hypothetical protein M1275_02885 [Patescibacteria group bacterium]|nr:hypothetical protein [Patescibacteria group bacterium]
MSSRESHPDNFHVEGETLTFGLAEVQPPSIGVPCEDECADTAPFSPKFDPAVEQGIKDGKYPPW